ncbi:hypothetical protein MMC29_000708 [Sticta canariensis]|nr:hypothetical protein [Sticta canariensis]
MFNLSEFVSDAFKLFVLRSLANLGETRSPAIIREDFSTPKTPNDSASHEKPPQPLGMLLMFFGILLTGLCVSALFLANWHYFLGVVPIKIMVFSPNEDDTEDLPKPRIWQLRRQISQFRFNLLKRSDKELMLWALYVFFLFNWLSDIVTMPFSLLFPPGLHKSVEYVLAAILLCPLQLIATTLSMKVQPLFSPPQPLFSEQISEKDQKEPSKSIAKAPNFFLPLLSGFGWYYRWLLPTTLLWATACELAKLPPLALSRTFSLNDRVNSKEPLRTLLLDSAAVFLVYVAACLLFVLPTTIAMRRTHASLCYLSDTVMPPDEPIRERTVLKDNKFLGVFEALRTFRSHTAARLVLVYSSAYCVMQVIKAIGFGVLVLWIKIIEERYGSTDEYMGFWDTLVWFFRRVIFRI